VQVNERRRRILDAVLERGMMSLREAAEVAGTSEVTARRDIRLLAESGLLRRTHGGAAAPCSPPHHEPSYVEKSAQASAEKHQIARAAAELIGDDDAIALGPGTTTLALACLLKDRRDLTVVTTSLLVCDALIDAPGVQVLVSGGSLRGATHALVGPLAESSLAGLHVRTLFLSGNGLSADRGLSTPDVLTAAVDRRLAETAAGVVVLVDHTKVDVEAMSQTVPTACIDRLITDERSDVEELRRLEAAGVAVTVCPVPV